MQSYYNYDKTLWKFIVRNNTILQNHYHGRHVNVLEDI